MGLLATKKTQKKKEMDVRLVGSVGNQVLYIIWTENGTEVPGSLWKLQWPGNALVDRWSEAAIRGSDGEFVIDSSERTANFFNQCLFPVNAPITDLEKRLVEKYGKNESVKLKVESIEPAMWKHWKKLESFFFDGELFGLVPESEE